MSDVVLIGGMPAGGKSTVTNRYTDKGYVRFNRDLMGGKLTDALPQFAAAIRAEKNVVVDNLFPTKASRAEFIRVAKQIPGTNLQFVLMDTSLEDAQFNACVRMCEKAGRVLHPEDHKNPKYRDDPNLFPVAVIYKYRKEFEHPTITEGFDSVNAEHFVRKYPSDWVNKAIIYDFDGTLRTHDGPEKYPLKPDQVRAFKNRKNKIISYQAQGYYTLGASNQSGVAKGILTCQDVEDCLHETCNQIGIKMEEVLYCPHKVPPISCYCRKPGPGMLVELIWKYKLDPRQCIFVGDQTSDKTCAARCGMKYMDQDTFFRN